MKTKTQAEQYAEHVNNEASKVSFERFTSKQLEQDWGKGTTTITFEDGSKLRVFEMDMKALESKD